MNINRKFYLLALMGLSLLSNSVIANEMFAAGGVFALPIFFNNKVESKKFGFGVLKVDEQARRTNKKAPLLVEIFADSIREEAKSAQIIEVPGGFGLMKVADRQKYIDKVRPGVRNVKFQTSDGNLVETQRFAPRTILDIALENKKAIESEQLITLVTCNNLGQSDLKAKEYSCNFIDNTLIKDSVNVGQNKNLFNLLSEITISASDNSINGSEKFCGKCFKKAFSISDYGNKDKFGEIERNHISEIKYQSFKNEFKKMIDAQRLMNSYNNFHRGSILSEVQNAMNDPVVINMGLNREALFESSLEKLTCNKFEGITSGVFASTYTDLDDYENTTDQLESSPCMKNTNKFITRFGKEVGLGSEEDFDMEDSNKLQKFKEAIQKYAEEDSEVITKIKSEEHAKNINELKAFTERISEKHQNITDICKEQNNGNGNLTQDKLKEIMLREILGRSDKAYKRGRERMAKIMAIDPNFIPVFKDFYFICNIVKKHSPEELKAQDFYSLVRMNNLTPEEKKVEIFNRMESFSNANCGSVEENIIDLVCSEPEELNVPGKFELDTKNMKADEKLVYRSMQCGNKSLTYKDSSEFLPPTHRGISMAVSNILKTQENDGSTGDKQSGSNTDNNDMSVYNETLKSMRTDSPGIVTDEMNVEYESSGRGSNSDGLGRNTAMTAEQILKADTPESIGSEALLATVPSDFTSSAEESINTEVEERAESENDFASKMEDILGQSYSNLNNANKSNNNKSISELIDSGEISKDDISDAIEGDKDLKTRYDAIKKKLSSADGLPDGVDPDEILEKVLSDKANLSEEDLKGSDNANLLAEIEKLKAQVAATVKKDKNEKVVAATNDEMESLRAENEKLKKILAAKVEIKNSSTTLSNSAKDSSGYYKGGTVLAGFGAGGSSRKGRSPAAVSGKNAKIAAERIIPNSVKNNLAGYDGKKLDLKFEGNSLFLTLKSKGIEKAPIEVNKIVVDDKGVATQVVFGSGRPVDISSLNPASQKAISVYILKNKESIRTLAKNKLNQNSLELDEVIKVNTQAKVDVVRYTDLSCTFNPESSTCLK